MAALVSPECLVKAPKGLIKGNLLQRQVHLGAKSLPHGGHLVGRWRPISDGEAKPIQKVCHARLPVRRLRDQEFAVLGLDGRRSALVRPRRHVRIGVAIDCPLDHVGQFIRLCDQRTA